VTRGPIEGGVWHLVSNDGEHVKIVGPLARRHEEKRAFARFGSDEPSVVALAEATRAGASATRRKRVGERDL